MNFNNENGSAKVVLIVLGVIFGGMLLLGVGIYAKINSLRSTSIQFETSLPVQYLDNQNMLSEFVNGFYEQVGVANLKSEKMDQILKDAVTGRYGEDGFSANGAFFAAVKEAYPDLAGLDVYDKIIDYVKAKRAEFKNFQTKLLSQLQAYDAWRQDGIVQSLIIEKVLGVPTDRLEARIGDTVYRGKEAREQMYKIVISGKTKDAFKSGEMGPLEVK
ncbi:hypothetical protein A2331_04570 [Candidatus Falkowbacteria bacterium RIFOXYB2_FULL_34_18]|uniref:Uncharacterized protein n=1 Tax=Candidatus Falkowbacteria bacterium RIFOXYD2_FULL_34_120 TaxID=1798007 RepID=A0A1F5TM68_9BACT|nr:MAG: hypothetical protein A2331_04570 [Candidatus Falkowbacteria bacterium RIFOXYB2_FULL_34_18]OGF30307.1 MAG: hypothetical protein A2500_06950 [Candidatus Falkowbacteria bacterium RIFOXYC12_FULL_34_55]OGF37857.1 MAG: hypothetical protein A2466_04075 [Candidatus Falkowbacteria bacterium RIFOXYC2_FULL_34_220]OGF39618.1 MAG: hypothetical protein A2515_03790 [Candidatus Falkowbacteria bacterium RIFOXYD12_FULL_34_57]OGF40042.1 MAG: hypothetical protein A2531_07520 [Candidatus Falkowbacteria bact